ncbi:FitA-like ribbon-helix-helix domain-containing protein [Azospirillum sp. sgz302134]
MGHLILHDLDDDLLNRLRTRAATHGRSLEEEHRAILEEALKASREEPWTPTTSAPDEGDFWERAARRRERLRGRDIPNTTQMIREMRDQRAGLIPDDRE